MSQYYNPQKTRNLFDPKSAKPFTVSRTGIDLFTQCPRCFYLEKRLGTSRPPGFPFSLNQAVDTLLKKEFDLHRAKGSAHPLMKTYKIDAVPFAHEQMDEWRDARLRGIQCLHPKTNLIIRGGIDDVWQNSKGELHIVDYKATSKSSEVTLDADWQIGYKRQVEVYQWLFRQNKFKVSNIAYFVYCNGDTDKEAFDGRLEFNVKILPYEGNDSWIDKTIRELYDCLVSDEIPAGNNDCDYCRYHDARQAIESEF